MPKYRLEEKNITDPHSSWRGSRTIEAKNTIEARNIAMKRWRGRSPIITGTNSYKFKVMDEFEQRVVLIREKPS